MHAGERIFRGRVWWPSDSVLQCASRYRADSQDPNRHPQPRTPVAPVRNARSSRPARRHRSRTGRSGRRAGRRTRGRRWSWACRSGGRVPRSPTPGTSSRRGPRRRPPCTRGAPSALPAAPRSSGRRRAARRTDRATTGTPTTGSCSSAGGSATIGETAGLNTPVATRGYLSFRVHQWTASNEAGMEDGRDEEKDKEEKIKRRIGLDKKILSIAKFTFYVDTKTDFEARTGLDGALPLRRDASFRAKTGV